MSDALTTIANLINSPPGQLVAGGVLAGIVWKFFKNVGDVLNEETNLEIAVWLLDRKKLSPTFQNWPDTFTKVFDRVFGEEHLSWKCFKRSCFASYAVCGLSLLIWLGTDTNWKWNLFPLKGFLYFVTIFGLLGNVLPDYLSLLETRYVLRLMAGTTHFCKHLLLVLLEFFITLLIASAAAVAAIELEIAINHPQAGRSLYGQVVETVVLIAAYKPSHFWAIVTMPTARLYLYPAFATSIWLWLYAGSGLLIQAARRFDIGFDWFNRHFDIEKKPLQSIGLVAGALVAVVYWAVVLVSRVMG